MVIMGSSRIAYEVTVKQKREHFLRCRRLNKRENTFYVVVD